MNQQMNQQRNKVSSFFEYKAHGLRCLLGFMVLAFIPTLSDAISVSDFNLPVQDSAGWTVLLPETDSYLVYVDASLGDDDTGQIYLPDDDDIGPDPQNPSGLINAFKSLNAAYAQLREDKPDWMLLKSGEVWVDQSLSLRRGQSPMQRAVVAAYGSGSRPELWTGGARAIQSTQASNIIISGIKFWAHTRDDGKGHFQSYSGADGFHFHTRSVRDVRVVSDILIEDCVFKTYSNNVITGKRGSSFEAPVVRFVFRRNIITENYSTDSHSQGLFYTAEGQPSQVPPAVLLEENLFDHNGWRIQSTDPSAMFAAYGMATKFNHNTYFVDAKQVLFKSNIFMRASSISNKWTANNGKTSADSVEMSNNLYIEGELGLAAAGNKPGELRFKQFKFNYNVLTDVGRAQPTNRPLAWNIQIGDWEQGEIIGNLILNQTNKSVDNVFAMEFLAQGRTDQLLVKNNYIYNLMGGNTIEQPLIWFKDGENTTDVQFMDNVVQLPHFGAIASIDALGSYDISGNNGYYSNGDPENWFVINNQWASLSDWIDYTGDFQAIVEMPNWSDPDRNIERYTKEIGIGKSFDGFIAALHNQSKSTWRSDLTAPKINNWFRAGFVPNFSEITLDFNRLNKGSIDSPIIIGEYELSSPKINNVSGSLQVLTGFFVSPVIRQNDAGGKIVIKRVDGDVFDLIEFQHGKTYTLLNGLQNLIVTASYPVGNDKKIVVSQHPFNSAEGGFQLISSDLPTLETKTLNWTGLESVSFSWENGNDKVHGVLDNIKLSM